MATYYLNADTGDNANAGTSALPWETMTYAHTTATDGDTIICQDSTAEYAFSTIIFTKSLSIEGVSTTGVVFAAGSTETQNRWYCNQTPALSLSVKNITFTTMKTQNGGFYKNIIDSSNLTVDNCIFKNIKFAGSGIVGSEIVNGLNDNNVTVTNCSFYGFIKTSTSNVVICDGHLSGDTGTYTFTNNTIVDNETTVTSSEDAFFNAYAGQYADWIIKNNIFYKAVEGELVSFSHASTTFENNCSYNFTRVPDGDNNITSDPLLVDIDASNFELQLDSPCIGTGVIL